MERALFTEYARRYKDTIFRVALNALGSPVDADDIVQETLLRLLERQEPFESEKHVKYWLIRVSLNLCKNELRVPWRRHKTLDDANAIPTFDNPNYSDLYEEIMRLPEKYRTVLYLFYFEGYSVNEIADILDIRVTTVTSRLSRARQKLGFQMTEHMEECTNE